MREKRKPKEKNYKVGGATVKGKWQYYDVMNFLEYHLQRITTDMFQRQQL
jgi:hypothetical protein